MSLQKPIKVGQLWPSRHLLLLDAHGRTDRRHDGVEMSSAGSTADVTRPPTPRPSLRHLGLPRLPSLTPRHRQRPLLSHLHSLPAARCLPIIAAALTTANLPSTYWRDTLSGGLPIARLPSRLF